MSTITAGLELQPHHRHYEGGLDAGSLVTATGMACAAIGLALADRYVTRHRWSAHTDTRVEGSGSEEWIAYGGLSYDDGDPIISGLSDIISSDHIASMQYSSKGITERSVGSAYGQYTDLRRRMGSTSPESISVAVPLRQNVLSVSMGLKVALLAAASASSAGYNVPRLGHVVAHSAPLDHHETTYENYIPVLASRAFPSGIVGKSAIALMHEFEEQGLSRSAFRQAYGVVRGPIAPHLWKSMICMLERPLTPEVYKVSIDDSTVIYGFYDKNDDVTKAEQSIAKLEDIRSHTGATVIIKEVGGGHANIPASKEIVRDTLLGAGVTLAA